jgi:tetratricopeptide (TPR) repeat protein
VTTIVGSDNAIRLARAFSGKLRIMTVTAEPLAYARFGPHRLFRWPLRRRRRQPDGGIQPLSLLTVKREAVLIAEVEPNIADIQSAYAEGRELLRQGFCEQAIERFQQCLRLNAYFPPALDASAEAHDRLRHADQAEQCRKQAALIRDQLWIRDSV